MVFTAGYSQDDSSKVIEKNLEIFDSYLKTLNSNYVDKVSTTRLVRTGIDAITKSLDPFSFYSDEEGVKAHNNAWKGYMFSGIGISAAERDSLMTVVGLYEKFPAHLAGVRMGDRVIGVDSIDVRGRKFEDVSKLLRGEEGTKVTVTFDRPGVGKVMIPIVRKKIISRSVSYYGMLNDSIGYIQCLQFLTNSYDTMLYALNTLKKNEKFRYLILDMRNNIGGLLQDAVNTANIFLPKDKMVCELKSENNKGACYKCMTLYEPVDTTIKIVALANNVTISAGELMLGAFQDYDRAVLVGQRTYGKGYVQGTRPLAYNGELYVTVARYYTPSGRCIQKIDYTHKYIDGKVNEVDSVKPVFYTQNHREVTGSGGIEPDIKLPPPPPLPEVVSLLINNNVIGDYATLYRNTHDTYPDMESFALSEKDMDEFLRTAKSKIANFNFLIESEIKKLDSLIIKNNIQNSLKHEIKKIKNKLIREKIAELQKNKILIKSLLEKEILIRYYNNEAIFRYSFKNDLEIKEAISTFTRYDSILSGNNPTEKTIPH